MQSGAALYSIVVSPFATSASPLPKRNLTITVCDNAAAANCVCSDFGDSNDCLWTSAPSGNGECGEANRRDAAPAHNLYYAAKRRSVLKSVENKCIERVLLLVKSPPASEKLRQLKNTFSLINLREKY